MQTPRRLLSFTEAAIYCHIPRSTFKAVCPVQPVRIHEHGRPLIDIKDLDKWIDSIKSGGKEEESDDDIVRKL